MKNIKLLALLLTSLHITPMHKDQYAYTQELNDIVIKNPELDRIFTSMQACDSAQGSFRQFIEDTLTSGHYDQQKASPRVIISQAEELISEKLKSNEAFSKKMKYQFIDAVNSVIEKDRVKKAEIEKRIEENSITSVPEQDRLNSTKNKLGRRILGVDIKREMDIITAEAEAMADEVQDPIFLYFTQNKNKSIQNIVRQWLLQEWELEWSRTDTLRQNHCNNTSTPLYTAISNTNTEIASMLIHAQVNLNIEDKHGNTPLHVAITNIDSHGPEVTSMLINAGANTDIQNKNGETPLHIAAQKSLSIARLFINARADVNIQNKNGETPLHIAAQMNTHVVQLLISIGAHLNMQNKHGETPLHIAVKTNYPHLIEIDSHIAKALIKAGADINIENNNGDTPLHILASRSSHTPQINSVLMELLIRAGADINFQNNKGETPLDIATQKNPLVATILKNLGARHNHDYNYISSLQAPSIEQTRHVFEQAIPETASCCNIS